MDNEAQVIFICLVAGIPLSNFNEWVVTHYEHFNGLCAQWRDEICA